MPRKCGSKMLKKRRLSNVGGKKYPVEIIVEDNESKAESAVKANTKLITQDDVIVIIGPQSSKQAVPRVMVANNYETPMISPWSTNPATTADRPYVFRGCFLDPFQGPVVANFITEEFGFTKAAVLYDVASDYPKDSPSSSSQHGKRNMARDRSSPLKASPPRHGFQFTVDQDHQSGAQVLFTHQYYNEVALIVQQAKDLGWKGPIVGSDSWGSAETIELCGAACYGQFFSTHYAAAAQSVRLKNSSTVTIKNSATSRMMSPP